MKKILGEGKYLRLINEDGWEYAQRKNCSGIVIVVAMTSKKKFCWSSSCGVRLGKKSSNFPPGLLMTEPASRKKVLRLLPNANF